MADAIAQFRLPLKVPGLPDAAPVYDLVLCHGGLQLAAVCPYYARPAWQNVEVFVDGEMAPFWIDDDPEHFIATTYCDVPPGRTGSEGLSVSVRKNGAEVFSTMVAVARTVHGKVSLATLAKFDWPWIAEWLDHHFAVGIEHAYVYNNGEPRLTTSLAPYIERGTVTEIAWPFSYRLYCANWVPFWPADSHWYTQCPQMMHAALKYGDSWSWMAFLDADEFLVPAEGRDLQDILTWERWKPDRPFNRVGALRLKGKWFGNSGYHERPMGSVRQNYLRCESGVTASTKEIVRPSAVQYTRIHWWTVHGETIHVDPDLLRFNHYRGISDHNVRRAPRFDNEYTNESEDRRILRWVGS